MTRSRRAVRRVYCGSWCSRCNPSIRTAQRERIAVAEARCEAVAYGHHHPATVARLRVEAIDDAQDETIPDSPDEPLADVDADRVLAWLEGAADAELNAMADGEVAAAPH